MPLRTGHSTLRSLNKQFCQRAEGWSTGCAGMTKGGVGRVFTKTSKSLRCLSAPKWHPAALAVRRKTAHSLMTVTAVSCLHGSAFHQDVTKLRQVTTADWPRRKGNVTTANMTFEHGPRIEDTAMFVTFEIRESHFWTAVGWSLEKDCLTGRPVAASNTCRRPALKIKYIIVNHQHISSCSHWFCPFRHSFFCLLPALFFAALRGVPRWQTMVFKNHKLSLLWGGKLGGWVGLGSTQWGPRVRWRKTVQRSQRSARRDRGSVGRPQRHTLSGCGMTAQAQLVLDARAAVGRSVQVIKPFKHSSTHRHSMPAAWMNLLQSITASVGPWSLSGCCPLRLPFPPAPLPVPFLKIYRLSFFHLFLSPSLILSYISSHISFSFFLLQICICLHTLI